MHQQGLLVGGFIRQNTLQKRIDPLVDFVGSELSGQREINARRGFFFQQLIGGIQRSLGFTQAHRGFQYIHTRLVRCGN